MRSQSQSRDLRLIMSYSPLSGFDDASYLVGISARDQSCPQSKRQEHLHD